jgi:hypothetical protein
VHYSGGSAELKKTKENLQAQIQNLETKISSGIQNSEEKETITLLEQKHNQISRQREDIYRSTLRLEAEQRVLQKSLQKSKEYDLSQADKKAKVFIEKEKASAINDSLASLVDQAIWRCQKNEFGEVSNFLHLLKHSQSEFFIELMSNTDNVPYIVADTSQIESELEKLGLTLHAEIVNLEVVETELSGLANTISAHKEQIEQGKNQFHAE